ncbi:unnamed protein product [Adineta steineri]|uniref:Uncharacterized protein n=1 Tax=Adineta steineri TaxID=433720 RepID=A0A814A059_9BILA|nr:unnamed protein product [Adineta steineri]CAF1046499.1 unnamed protein product [Adineta steineri]
MFYENLIPYYSPYEEQVLLRQMNNTFNQHKHHHHHQQQYKQHQQDSFYYFDKRKEYTSSSTSSLINSSLLNNPPLSSSSPSVFPTSTKQPISKKVITSDVDALSFCHTIYVTIKKNLNSPSCTSPNYTHQLPGDSQLLLLPDICCTIPASKLRT